MHLKFQQFNKKLHYRIKENVILAPFTTFKIGGPADYFYDAKTTEEMVIAIITARELDLPVFILGGGTNILIGDKGIRGLVIRNSTENIQIRGMKGKTTSVENKRQVFVEADSGVLMNKLVRFTVEEGLSGLETHLGLPGSVGGALFMNSKWTHPVGYVGDAVYQAKILRLNNEIHTEPKSYFQFAYDSSTIQKTGDIVLTVVYSLVSGSKETLWKIANDCIAHRRTSQPQGVKSAGCVFKNINGSSSGLLIDKAGLKGLQIGDAQISPIHANFIINLGKATALDVLQLVGRAKEQVKHQFGITLEEEIVCVGEF